MKPKEMPLHGALGNLLLFCENKNEMTFHTSSLLSALLADVMSGATAPSYDPEAKKKKKRAKIKKCTSELT